MIALTVTCNRYKPQNPAIALDRNGVVRLDMPDGETLEELLAELGVSDTSGKVIRVNKESVFDFYRVLADGDRIEIFQMCAGG